MFDEYRGIDIESSTIPVLWFQTFGFNFFSSSFLFLSTHLCVVFFKSYTLRCRDTKNCGTLYE